jgi:hypothetical protein
MNLLSQFDDEDLILMILSPFYSITIYYYYYIISTGLDRQARQAKENDRQAGQAEVGV